MQYQYHSYDSHGAKISGEIEAASVDEAKRIVNDQGLVLVSIKEVRSDTLFSFLGSRNKRISLKSLEFITSELAILLNSGVKIDKGLSILRKGASDPASQLLLQSLSDDIKRGASVSEAFGKHSDIFDDLFINMVMLGESSGNLSDVFEKLSNDLKFRRDLQSKIIQSLTYPAIILAVCILCVLFVFNYIVPQMSSIFDRSEELPFYTELLLGLSDWFINYQWYFALALLVTFVLARKGLNNPSMRIKFDEWGLRLPLIGKGILLIERIRFNTSMQMGLSSGVSLVQALKLAQGNIKNSKVRVTLNAVRSRIKQGDKLSNVFKTVPLYSDFHLSLIEVGEESGNLEPIFAEIASRSRADFEGWTKTLTSMIEPILILFMAAIVGSVVIVMLLSIVGTNDIGI